MGRENAQAVASLLIQEHPARCLAMSGICAGRRDKVALGDVIFADRLWSYDAGKSTVDDGEQRFRECLQISSTTGPDSAHAAGGCPTRCALAHTKTFVAAWSLQKLDPCFGSSPVEILIAAAISTRCVQTGPPRSLAFGSASGSTNPLTNVGRVRATELQLLHPRGLPSPANFQVHVAIATGAAVTEDAGIFPRLATSMRKVLGVEMEASALGVLGELHGVPALVAKGVSDYGDLFKDDRYQFCGQGGGRMPDRPAARSG